ncbi:type IV pili twitching motility protein PilT [bacterium]|nr:type IV pili twitching motility protein PilT [bacterium]
MSTQPRIELLLEEVIKRKASDLHLQVGLAPILRVDGSLTPVAGADILTEETVESLIFAVLDADQKQILLKDKEFDFSFAFGDLGRFRVNAFHERGNLAAALRLIPNEKVNQERATHILTIEDPIEFTHKSAKSVIVQREVHYDTYSFGAALRSALRQDPDVVLIGEMRDLETIASAITIAETGHLVFATLHTNSAAQSIDRMIDVFPSHQQPQIRSQLSNILMAICSQRLVPTIGGGRIAAAEILVATPAVRNIIREGKTHQLEAVIQTGAEHGMQSMDKTLVNLIHAGTISYEEARNYAIDIDELDRLMRS